MLSLSVLHVGADQASNHLAEIAQAVSHMRNVCTVLLTCSSHGAAKKDDVQKAVNAAFGGEVYNVLVCKHDEDVDDDLLPDEDECGDVDCEESSSASSDRQPLSWSSGDSCALSETDSEEDRAEQDSSDAMSQDL